MFCKFSVSAFHLLIIKRFMLVFLGFGIFLGVSVPARAQFDIPLGEEEEEIIWEKHDSITGIFSVKFPTKYQYRILPFRYNHRNTAFSVEIVSSLSGNATIKKGKSIMVRATQTFGGVIPLWLAKQILDREAKRYAESAAVTGGKVMTNDDIVHNEFPGKDLYILYTNSAGQKHGMRIRIYMTNYAKVEQVMTGSAASMFSYIADDFFDSIVLYDGLKKLDEPRPFGTNWTEYTSPNNVFTVKLLPTNPDYTPKPPQFSANATQERMSFKFVDPVVKEDVYYDVYSYRLENDIDFELAKRLLFLRHVKKYIENASIEGLSTTASIESAANIITTRLIIEPPEDKDYLSTLLLKLYYRGNTMVVQEVLSSTNHSVAGFPKLLRDSLTFHPERYKHTPPSE